MTSMMGVANNQEDMFARLDSMRAVINEVNTQFKDPVRLPPSLPLSLSAGGMVWLMDGWE